MSRQECHVLGIQLYLTQSLLLVWVHIAYFNQMHKPYPYGMAKLAADSGCGEEEDAAEMVEVLLDIGFLKQGPEGLYVPSYIFSKEGIDNDEAYYCKNWKTEWPQAVKESSKENSNNKTTTNTSISNSNSNNSKLSLTATDTDSNNYPKDFLQWWADYDCNPRYINYQNACYKIWRDDTPEDWRKLALKHAKNHHPNRPPLYWLKYGDYFKCENAAGQPVPLERPVPLRDGLAATEMVEAGKEVWFVRPPDSDKGRYYLREVIEPFVGKNGYVKLNDFKAFKD